MFSGWKVKPYRLVLFSPILRIDLEDGQMFSGWKGNQTENVGK
jgi:hypothetical protein